MVIMTMVMVTTIVVIQYVIQKLYFIYFVHCSISTTTIKSYIKTCLL